MTHFVSLVIVPKEVIEDGDVEEYIEEKMQPYSEELEVTPYISKPNEEVEKELTKWLGLGDEDE